MIREFIFYALFLCLFRISSQDKDFWVVVLDKFFIWETKKVVAGRVRQVGSSYTVTIVWEFALVDLALAVLQRWSFNKVWI